MPPPHERALQQVQVVATRLEAEQVTSYVLARPDGGELAPWQPGAHIDVHLPSGTVRQYSLCGDPDDRRSYRIAVLELPEGRGGSREVHRELRAGALLRVGLPRLNFRLVEADRYLFIAGGIGITPLLPMIREAHQRQRPWKLVYAARTRLHFAFATELGALLDDQGEVCFVAEDEDGRPDLAQLVNDAAGAAVYTCGPAAMMDALAARMASSGRVDDLHLERFSASPPPSAEPLADGFEIELAGSGRVIQVGSGETILEALRNAGVDHTSSCEMGICGTCETKVLAGEVDHRDEILTEQERTSGATMMICISRAACPRLVLDL